jgi:hypothetical protein
MTSIVYDASICSAALRCWASCGSRPCPKWPTHIFNTLNILLLLFYPSKIYKRLIEDLRMMSSMYSTNSGNMFAVAILRSRSRAVAQLSHRLRCRFHMTSTARVQTPGDRNPQIPECAAVSQVLDWWWWHRMLPSSMQINCLISKRSFYEHGLAVGLLPGMFLTGYLYVLVLSCSGLERLKLRYISWCCGT